LLKNLLKATWLLERVFHATAFIVLMMERWKLTGRDIFGSRAQLSRDAGEMAIHNQGNNSSEGVLNG
jgi:hypothetical protein